MRGHLRQRGSNWELRAFAGRDPGTGRRVYVTRTFRGGKREAEEALARLVAEVSGGGHASQDTTVADLLRNWLEHAQPNLSPTTARGYDWIARTYILPSLGSRPLSRLRTADLDRFYGGLLSGGGQDGKALSPATVRQVHAILRRALEQALRWGWLTTNPAALASPPRVRATVVEAPEPEDIVRLIDAALADDADFGTYLHVAAMTGARRGELCALQWRDVDDTTHAVLIRRNVVEGARGALVIKDTKTHAARRVALDRTTATLLAAHRERALARAAATGLNLRPDAFLFSNAITGDAPWVPNEVTKRFIRLRNKIGADKVRLHDLRHFAATRLLAAGVPVRTVSGRLGHANAATTLGVYAHFVESSDRDAAAKLEALLASSRSPGPAS